MHYLITSFFLFASLSIPLTHCNPLSTFTSTSASTSLSHTLSLTQCKLIADFEKRKQSTADALVLISNRVSARRIAGLGGDMGTGVGSNGENGPSHVLISLTLFCSYS